MKLTAQIDKFVTLTIDDTAMDTTIQDMQWFFTTILTFMMFKEATIDQLFDGEIDREFGKVEDD